MRRVTRQEHCHESQTHRRSRKRPSTVPALAGDDPANAEINAGNLPPSTTPTLTREEILKEQRSGRWFVLGQRG